MKRVDGRDVDHRGKQDLRTSSCYQYDEHGKRDIDSAMRPKNYLRLVDVLVSHIHFASLHQLWERSKFHSQRSDAVGQEWCQSLAEELLDGLVVGDEGKVDVDVVTKELDVR